MKHGPTVEAGDAFARLPDREARAVVPSPVPVLFGLTDLYQRALAVPARQRNGHAVPRPLQPGSVLARAEPCGSPVAPDEPVTPVLFEVRRPVGAPEREQPRGIGGPGEEIHGEVLARQRVGDDAAVQIDHRETAATDRIPDQEGSIHCRLDVLSIAEGGETAPIRRKRHIEPFAVSQNTLAACFGVDEDQA